MFNRESLKKFKSNCDLETLLSISGMLTIKQKFHFRLLPQFRPTMLITPSLLFLSVPRFPGNVFYVYNNDIFLLRDS